jgi:hypothetical protein
MVEAAHVMRLCRRSCNKHLWVETEKTFLTGGGKRGRGKGNKARI